MMNKLAEILADHNKAIELHTKGLEGVLVILRKLDERITELERRLPK